MAKKRKEKDEAEEVDFKIPKFDEEKFIKKEKRNIKTTLLSFLFGFLIAIISFGFWSLLSGNDLRFYLVFLFGFICIVWLRYLFIRLKIDLTDFGRKGWFTSYAIYFFTWLLVLIVIVNPPFYDDESPQVNVVILPDSQEVGGTIFIAAMINDNTELEKENIEFMLTYPDGTNINPEFNYDESNSIFTYTYENPDDILDEYSIKIIATDKNGHQTEYNGTFSYGNDTIKLPEPIGTDSSPGPKVTYTTSLKFDVEADVDRFYYTVDSGSEINVEEKDGFYVSYPKFEGWVKNKNVKVRAYADVIHYFENYPVEFNNTIVDSSIYYFNVSDAIEIGGEEPPELTLPGPTFVTVPGFELVVFLISLIVVALIFKYRKKHKRN